MVEELFVLLALGGAIVAFITDVKSRIIPNKLTFPLMGLGVFGYLVFGVIMGDFEMFLASVKSLLLMFIVGRLLCEFGLLSPGDAKGYMFIAALVPVYPVFLLEIFNPTVAYYPFIITIFVNSFISMYPFLFVYSIGIALKKGLGLRLISPLKNSMAYLETSFIFMGAISISSYFSMGILTLLALVILYRIPRKYRLLLTTFLILAYVFPLADVGYSRASSISLYFVFMFLLITGTRLFINILNVLRKDALTWKAKITDLKDGDIVGEEIYIAEGEVLRDERSMVEKIKEAVKTGSYQTLLKRNIIAKPNSIGVTEKQIEILKGYVKEGKLEDIVTLKMGMPFASGLLTGLIVSLVLGDIIFATVVWFYG